MLYRLAYGQSLQIVRIASVAALNWIHLPREVRDMKSSSLVLPHDCCNTQYRSIVATANIASELISGRHGVEMGCNLRVSKATKHAGVSVTFCGWDFRIKSVNGAVRSLK
jgi:hypothetical protein